MKIIAIATVAIGLAAASASASPQKAQKLGYFKTPTGNIICVWAYGKDSPFIECGIKTGLKPKPKNNCAKIGIDYVGNRVDMKPNGRPKPVACAGDAGPFAYQDQAKALPYGKTWSGGGMYCASFVNGLLCSNNAGHGFFLSKQIYRTF